MPINAMLTNIFRVVISSPFVTCICLTLLTLLNPDSNCPHYSWVEWSKVRNIPASLHLTHLLSVIVRATTLTPESVVSPLFRGLQYYSLIYVQPSMGNSHSFWSLVNTHVRLIILPILCSIFIPSIFLSIIRLLPTFVDCKCAPCCIYGIISSVDFFPSKS